MTALLRYVEVAQRRGLSMNTALECYRAAGGKTRREVFALCWRSTTDKAAQAELARRVKAA